jgi:hypothetical protein
MNRVVAYVDGFNLYFGLKEGYGRRYHRLDLQRLVTDLLRPDQQLRAVQYFTARIRDDPEGGSRQSTYLDALANHSPLVRITEGRFKEGRADVGVAELGRLCTRRRRRMSTLP